MNFSRETEAIFAALRQSAKPQPVSAIEKLIENGPDRQLCRINALAFAADHKLNEEDVIAAFLHAGRLGIFEVSWNILCPGCGGVLGSGTTLKTINQADYSCPLCAAAYEPTLDEMVEVTFTVSPRVRKIPAHDPETLPWIEYFKQVYWSSGVDLPDDDTLAKLIKEITLHTAELPPGEKVELLLQLPEGRLDSQDRHPRGTVSGRFAERSTGLLRTDCKHCSARSRPRDVALYLCDHPGRCEQRSLATAASKRYCRDAADAFTSRHHQSVRDFRNTLICAK